MVTSTRHSAALLVIWASGPLRDGCQAATFIDRSTRNCRLRSAAAGDAGSATARKPASSPRISASACLSRSSSIRSPSQASVTPVGSPACGLGAGAALAAESGRRVGSGVRAISTATRPAGSPQNNSTPTTPSATHNGHRHRAFGRPSTPSITCRRVRHPPVRRMPAYPPYGDHPCLYAGCPHIPRTSIIRTRRPCSARLGSMRPPLSTGPAGPPAMAPSRAHWLR